MTLDSLKGAAAAGAKQIKDFAKNGAEKAQKLGKAGYNTAKEYGKKGVDALKDLKIGEKLKPLAKDTIEFGKETAKFVKANPGKTAIIATAGFVIGAVYTKILMSIFHKTPEKTQSK